MMQFLIKITIVNFLYYVIKCIIYKASIILCIKIFQMMVQDVTKSGTDKWPILSEREASEFWDTKNISPLW